MRFPYSMDFCESAGNNNMNKMNEGPEFLFLTQAEELLGALTPDTFYELSGQLLHLLTDGSGNEKDDETVMQKSQKFLVLTELIVSKALDGPSLSYAYARLVQFISQHLFPEESGEDFLKGFLETFQSQVYKFLEEEISEGTSAGKQKSEEARWKCRIRVLGMARLAGELFKLGLVPPEVVKEFVGKSLGKKTEESLEFLYDLLMNCGNELERSAELSSGDLCGEGKQKDFQMEDLFEKLQQIALDSSEVSLRARVAISDLVEHRDKYWKSRRVGSALIAQCQMAVNGFQFGNNGDFSKPAMHQASNYICDLIGVNKPKEPIRRYHREELLRIGRQTSGKGLIMRVNVPIPEIIKAGFSSKLSTESISPRPIENYCGNQPSLHERPKNEGPLSLNEIDDTISSGQAKSDRVSMWLLLAKTKRFSEDNGGGNAIAYGSMRS